MVEFADITQGIIAPQLEIFGVERDPSFVGAYNMPNTLTRGLANVLGVEGQWSKLIGATVNALGVTDLNVHDYYTQQCYVMLSNAYDIQNSWFEVHDNP